MKRIKAFRGDTNKRAVRAPYRNRRIRLEPLETRLVLDATIVPSVSPSGHITLAWTGDTSADNVTVTYDSISPQFTFSDPGHTIYVQSEPYLTINNNDSSTVSIAPYPIPVNFFEITQIQFSDGTTTGTLQAHRSPEILIICQRIAPRPHCQ